VLEGAAAAAIGPNVGGLVHHQSRYANGNKCMRLWICAAACSSR
jgi:hypothetical protein